MTAMVDEDGPHAQTGGDCACSRCGADLLSTGEILRGMCMRCLNAVNDPTCQTYSP